MACHTAVAHSRCKPDNLHVKYSVATGLIAHANRIFGVMQSGLGVCQLVPQKRAGDGRPVFTGAFCESVLNFIGSHGPWVGSTLSFNACSLEFFSTDMETESL